MDSLLQAFLELPKKSVKSAKDEIGYPVVMKIVSPDIIHKSDAGGVKVGLKNDNEIRLAFKEIMNNAKNYKPDAQIKGILIRVDNISKRSNSWSKIGSVIWSTSYGGSRWYLCRSS